MPNDETDRNDGFCAEVQMTPTQCNTVIEEKLDHLEPVFQCVLSSLEHVSDVLANGGVNWRRAFQRAKQRVDASYGK